MNKIKKIGYLTPHCLYALSILAYGLIGSPSASAAVINEVMTPPSGWSAPTGALMAAIDAGGEASDISHTDTSVALRNAPSINFNPDLDALVLGGGTDNKVHEAGFFPISSNVTTCSDSTPVTITVGTSVSTVVDMGGTVPNPSGNNSSHALFDMSGPSVSYLSVSENNNIGEVYEHPGDTYVTTFGNLENIYMVANVEVVVSAITNSPNGSQAHTTESIPSITLSYNNADCPISPTIEHANVEDTIVSTDTANGAVVIDGSRYGAADANEDTLIYSISDGNDDGYFAIDSASGDIATTRANVPIGTYTMTVLIDDGNGGTVEVTVTITVTDSGELLADTGVNNFAYLLLSTALIITPALYLVKRRYNR